MGIDAQLSTYSDWSFVSATAIYLLAMGFAAVAQALGRTSKPVAARQLVTVGGGAEPPAARSAPPTTGERISRMGLALTWLGLVLHAAAVVLRGLAVQRWPLGNLYEYIMFLTLVAVAAWLAVAARFPVRKMAVWVLLPVAALMVLNGKVFYALAAPVQPALQSYWLVIHVTTAAAATGALVVPGIASIGYLVRDAHDKRPQWFHRVAPKLPASDVLDRVAYRTTIIGFPLFTFAVICGAIWAEAAWGRFWGWDPKEATSFIAWLVYAAYLHARATAGWRERGAAVLNVLGMITMLFNLLFINLAADSLHSYSGVG
ncbi:c-type cytochrome biogenesis protein CcsB [Saccharopolyspora shandongensis]|uniref:c-type cytochrome biogenesis protein CcsB n=1 Tax=Saccharopolyspora shandongensis TaxID=418495 RepID=UPI00343FE390